MARFVWYASLAIVALVTASLQIDRESARNPALAPLVPEAMRSFAQVPIAQRSAQVAGQDQSLRDAKLLVQRRPVPAETLRILAMAQFSAGQSDAGIKTIQIAAQRGWRDPLTQSAMLQIAMSAGDEAEAARRFTALMLRPEIGDTELHDVAASLFALPDSAAALTLIDILAGTERWQNAFLRRGARVLPAKTFAHITAEAQMQGAVFECPALQAALQGITNRDETAGTNLKQAVETTC